MHKLSFFFSAVFIIESLHVVFAGGEGPFTPKASLIRYWKKQISNDLPQPSFLLDKASPLTAVQSAAFSKLAAGNSLAAQLPSFCAAAHLFCYPDLAPSLENHPRDVNFKGYGEQNFTNYGTGRVGKRDSFDSYAPDGNSGLNSFRRYSRDSVGHDDKFSNYAPDTNVPDQSFNSYGTETTGGHGDFKKYTEEVNVAAVRFTSYSDDTGGREQKFTAYSNNGNGGDQSFTTYGKSGRDAANAFTSYGNNTNGVTSSFGNYGEDGKIGNDSFTSYGEDGNVPGNNFKNYGTGGNGATDSFTSYGDFSNSGGQSFTGYGKSGNGAKTDFRSYGNNTNVVSSSFGNYGESGNGGEDSFTSYGEYGTIPAQNFKSYATGADKAVETFKNYRDQSTIGDDSFTTYAKDSNVAAVKFANYGKSFHEGTDTFSGYGVGGKVENQQFGFKIYGVNNTFKDYADKKRVSFASYAKRGSGSSAELEEMKARGKIVNKWVEPGKFFRESSLKSGSIMPMPDIRDKMPKRSFLPRVISSKLPFSTSKLGELKKIFHAGDNSSMEGMMANALSECERAPSRGESKRCVGSIEDMIDFATSILGRNVAVRTTENTIGSKGNVMVGEVKGINGGKITKSVSCHQSLFPYLLYYCHSVPKVRVYEADLLDPKTKSKINHGVAICHIDTSSWSATHGAFLALGSGPGKIEVCHWIFENDMTWAVAD